MLVNYQAMNILHDAASIKLNRHRLGGQIVGTSRAYSQGKRIIVFLFTKSAKDSIAIQTCKLSEEEFNEFLALYSIPSSYHVILPKSNQTILDAPPGYVHISRLNPFGCAKLTTFVVMCKAYGCEPTVELFRGFFNLWSAGKWLTFAKRPEKHVPHLFPKVITYIKGWKERFFYVQDFIVPAKYPQLLLAQKKFNSKSYKDKLPLDIEQNPMFQRLGVILRAFMFFQIPSFFWLASNLRGNMANNDLNFVYAEDEEDLSFLPKEPSPAFGTGSSYMSVNIEPLMTDEEPVLQPTEAMTDSGGIPKCELFVVHPESVAARMKNMKFKTSRGSSRPPVKRKLAPGSSTARATHATTSALKDDVSFIIISDEDKGLSDVPKLIDATACHLKISNITPPAWKNNLDNYMDLELLDLHDRCYAQQAFVDNDVNRRSRELLGVIKKLRGECDVIKEKVRAQEEDSKGLRAKCEAAMSDFEKNPTVVALREKISTLSSEAKEHKPNLDRMMLESQKWAGYQANLSSLESQVVSLEAEKAWLEAVEVYLRKEVDDVRWDRMEVISKVVPYAAMELIYGDDLGSLAGKLVTSAIVYGRCKAFEQVATMKEPFDLKKVKGYRSSYKKEHNQAGNDLAITTFPWLLEFVADPSTPVEVLLSKKPPSIQKPAPSKTQYLVASSQKATPSYVLASNMMSPPADTSVVKPSWNECYDNEDELQSFRHKARKQDKVYDEREESCWILHLCTGIFYLKGHEGVMNKVLDGAAIFASSYWLRNSDMYRV
ncbi:hypothetical protein Tco_0486624 [Tanacetum coccineum]